MDGTPALVDDLVDHLLCISALIQLQNCGQQALTSEASSTLWLVYHASSCPSLHLLLLQITPKLSLDWSCLHNNTHALEQWSKIWHTKPNVRGVDGKRPPNVHLIMDSLSGLGHLNGLEWWLAHEQFVKPFMYSEWAIQLAVVKDHAAIVHWWIKNQTKLPLKLSLDLLLKHAIQIGSREYLDKWSIEYDLPLPHEYQGALVPQAWREPDRCRPVIEWWLEQVAASSIPALYDSNPLAYPAMLGHPDLMRKWIQVGLSLPESFPVWIMDEASKRGFPATLDWWMREHNSFPLLYTHDAIDDATFPGYRPMFELCGDVVQLRQVPLRDRLAVFDWWVKQQPTGLELKYSPTLVADLLRYGVSAFIPPATVIAVASWWLRSELPMSVVINPKQLAPDIRRWWDEHQSERMARRPEPWVEPSKTSPETPQGYIPSAAVGSKGIMAKIKQFFH